MAGNGMLLAVLIAVTAFILGLGADLWRNKTRQRREQLALAGVAPAVSSPATAGRDVGARGSEEAVHAPARESTSGSQPPPQTKAADHHGAGGGALWIRWTLATAVGWAGANLMGFFVGIFMILPVSIERLFAPPAVLNALKLDERQAVILTTIMAAVITVAALIVIGAMFGIAVAVPQAVVLRPWGAGIRSWVGATAMGFAVWVATSFAVVMAIAPVAVAGSATRATAGFPVPNVTSFIGWAPQSADIAGFMALAVQAAVGGAVIGIPQGRALRWPRGRVRVWALATATVLALSGAAGGAILRLAGAPPTTWPLLYRLLAGWFAQGLGMGIISGGVLALLLRRPARANE